MALSIPIEISKYCKCANGCWCSTPSRHHCPELAAQFLQHHQFPCLFLVYIPSITYAEGSWKETASAWIRSPELVPIPGHRARRSACGLGTSGSTSVVLASRIHDCVGPRENAGPKPMLLWPRGQLGFRNCACWFEIALWSRNSCWKLWKQMNG